MSKKRKVRVDCRICSNEFILQVNQNDLKDWQEGKYIQDAMPYLSAGERELLISNICEECFTNLFSEE